MFANSREIRSAQTGPHPRLDATVRKHLDSPYLRIPGKTGSAAFSTLIDRLAVAPFVLDSGCGTGASTLALAVVHANREVVGIDKSADRLSAILSASAPQKGVRKTIEMPQNAHLLHGELVDFWQRAAAAGLHCAKQYFLYPNPWPKPEHLKRRWHGHPVWPSILALGGEIELRTNWRVYADEFALALRLGGRDARVESFAPIETLTPFERKYAASGHALWRCVST